MAISLRGEFDAGGLRGGGAANEGCGLGPTAAGVVAVYNGAARIEAARIGSVTLQIVQD
jgi:hypothetical protein